ncbi:hypothetical protein BCT47_01695 [Vibrio splendidus]|jgi:SOS-response transcriptional repressor LexA|uniref:Helix-turn-helix domain-containing protein n=1 Tax=Vibrio splendidus TaxID=29497 RepID=A0AB35MVX9_VIBSP|nr:MULTISPECIES: helix-turn-helix domain-containing protein [Vibrio]MBE8565613.1 helix-turn-helix domain-containing protein [Vibrio sp. OPT20]MDH5886901.1 helix-turn-helix domain containing protein [Vibrio splendidus]MDH5904138.1 helix-turn-helix domain containing protein [Vibrio splendidus]MDH5976323.1 helix-turn-helix domain containing protein [Vibrio splendidus]MDH6018505.1 helix-turn-helix domain containing protein [Vibrio splendidus]
MTELSILATNIDQRKKDLNIRTNIEIARLSGVSRAVITNIMLHPEKSIMLDSAVSLANALDCRLEWLATGNGPVNYDDVVRHARIKFGSPVVTMQELSASSIKDLLEDLMEDEHRERLPCPARSSETTFIIRLNNNVGRYFAGGMIFFDYDKTAVSGDLVLARVREGVMPEIMEYQIAHGREFLKSMNPDIPEDLKFVEMSDSIKIIAAFSAFAVI